MTSKFSLLQFAFWCAYCSFLSFAGMYFLHMEYSYTFVGQLIALSILAGIAGQIFWGFCCDKLKSRKKVYIIANSIALIAILFLLFENPVLSTVIMIIVGFTQIPQSSVLDSWILNISDSIASKYGFTRMWATVGFCAFGFIIGNAIESVGYWIIFCFVTAFTVLNISVAAITPDTAYSKTTQTISLNQLFRSYGLLIRNKRFLIFLTACLFIGLGHQSANSLLSIIVTDVGGSAKDLSIAIFVSAVAEIPLFFFSSKLMERFSLKTCLITANLFFIIQFILLMTANSVASVTIAMMFQGIAFAILLPALRVFVQKTAVPELTTSALTLTDAINTGLAGAVASIIGSAVIEVYGISILFFVALILGTTSLILFLINSDSR